MKEEHVVIDADGCIRFIHDDALLESLWGAGEIDVRRASHVEPVKIGTRRETWWRADMSPVDGGSNILPTRAAALAWEVEQLQEMGIPTPNEQ